NLFGLLGQVQPSGHFREGSALYHQGNQGTEEYDVEHQVGIWNIGRQDHNGKNNGNGPPKADPGNKGLVPYGHLSEGKKANKNAQGPRHKNHQKADDEPGDYDRDQFTGIYEQSQGKEHEQFAHPGHPIEEVHGGSFVHKAGVPDHQPPNIDRQEPISFDKIAEGKDKDTKGKYKDGVEGPIVNVQMVDGPDRQFSKKIPGHAPDDQL